MLAVNRADHGPKHAPGEDLGRKGRKLTAIREPAPNLVKKERRRTMSMSSSSARHIAIDKDDPITEALSLKPSGGLSVFTIHASK